MPLIAAAAAAAVAPPPPRRVAPLRSLSTRRPGILALTATSCSPSPPPPVAAEAPAPAPPQEAKPKPKPKPRRYPKQYPGESVGVAEEMRFVAMRLRNRKRTTIKDKAGTADAGAGASEDEEDDGGGVKEEHEKEEEGELEEGEWMPSMEGFVRYLVDSKLVFGAIERVVAESTDVACESQFSSPFFALSAILVNCRGL